MVRWYTAGGWFNIKMSSYQYRKSHCGDKTVVRSSYPHNGISYIGKMSSLYWISLLNVISLVIYVHYSGTILGMDSANERRHYIATSFLIDWAHTQNDSCYLRFCTFGFIVAITGRFTHIYFTHTDVMTRLPKCSWSNLELKTYMQPIRISIRPKQTQAKQNQAISILYGAYCKHIHLPASEAAATASETKGK